MEELERKLNQNQQIREEEELEDLEIENQLLDIIEPLLLQSGDGAQIKEQLENYKNEKEFEKFFQILYEQLINPESEINKSYNDIYWEFVNQLVRSLNSHSRDWNVLNPLNVNSKSVILLNILEWLSLNSSPREFLLVIEEFQVSSFIRLGLFTKISLINLSKHSLKRIKVEKRLVFLKSLLSPMIKLLIEEKELEDKESLQKQQQQQQQNLNIETEEIDDEDSQDENNNESGDQQQQQQQQGVKIVGPEKEELLSQTNTDSDLKWQYPLTVILEFVHSFIVDLNQESVENYKLDAVSEQQHLLLQFILQLLSLESVASTPQPLLCNGFPIVNLIGDCLSDLGISIPYILNSDKRFRGKKREMELEDMYLDEGLDDEDFQDDPDLQSLLQLDENQPKTNFDDDLEEEEEDETLDILWDLNLSYAGIGHLLYLLLLKSNETHKLPSIISSQSLLMDSLPYIISLLQHSNYKLGFKAIQMISFLEKRIKNSSIHIPLEYLKNPDLHDPISDLLDSNNNNNNNSNSNNTKSGAIWIFDKSTQSLDVHYHFLQLIECMINYLVKCPVQKIRSFSYKVFVLLLNSLSADSRFNLLSTLIQTCIFPSFTGLLVHIFKEQIDHAWNDSSSTSSTDQKAYFVSPKILEIVTYPLQPGGNMMERMDTIMNGLNLYRYLLIRDKETNYTSIWHRAQIQASRDISLLPLKRDLEKVQSEFQSSANGDEATMKKLLSSVSKMGLEELSKEEVQKASTLVVFHLDMAIDIINRIFELQDTLKSDD
ncbi:hypothetical protein DLAC_09687 [Tieghemostelium lacteum]|uniref:Uncharacterized protein n=1 Tax=Tieghemostelium lacteum TaxID=361077 RepID=A0A151Z6Y1_TIELA|nr:hypothetical protein DLAC_09687 [Tieghemostelium lacteum]|eukprot:KYQ89719.1 hypothetical protein DLAC_09687 [Tieghemostelium lacteum]